MITIKYNNEFYEVIRHTVYRDEGLAVADYAASIGDYVQNIVDILAACNIECVVEEL